MQKLAIVSNEVMNIHIKQLDNRRLTSASTVSSVAARKERSQRWISKRQECVRQEAGEGLLDLVLYYIEVLFVNTRLQLYI